MQDEPAIEKLNLSPASEKVIARSLPDWFSSSNQWTHHLMELTMRAGTPLMAHLPNHFLRSVPHQEFEKFLFHIRNWRWDANSPYGYGLSPTSSHWSDLSADVQRIWAHLTLNKSNPPNKWTPKILRQLGFMLTGATEDELGHLPKDLRISNNIRSLLNLPWSMLQARAIFDVFYSESNDLSEEDIQNVKHLVPSLLPRQIQQFSVNATDFSFIAKHENRMSLVVEKQVIKD